MGPRLGAVALGPQAGQRLAPDPLPLRFGEGRGPDDVDGQVQALRQVGGEALEAHVRPVPAAAGREAGAHRLGRARQLERRARGGPLVQHRGGQRRQAAAIGSLPRRAAIRGRLVAQPRACRVERRGIVGMEHGLHEEDLRMGAERLHGAEDHGLPANDAVLFGAAIAGAKPAAGCDENGGSPFRFCHATQITVICGG